MGQNIGDGIQIITRSVAQVLRHAGGGQIVDRVGQIAQGLDRVANTLVEGDFAAMRPFQRVEQCRVLSAEALRRIGCVGQQHVGDRLLAERTVSEPGSPIA